MGERIRVHTGILFCHLARGIGSIREGEQREDNEIKAVMKN